MVEPIEIMARAIYEDRNRNMRNCWSWDSSGLDVEHPGHRARLLADAKAALSALEAEGYEVRPKPETPVVIVHITDESGIPTGYLAHGDVRLFVVDENVPNDRVYEMTERQTIEEIRAIVPEDAPIGSKHDARHPALEAAILAHVEGRPRFSIVGGDDGEG